VILFRPSYRVVQNAVLTAVQTRNDRSLLNAPGRLISENVWHPYTNCRHSSRALCVLWKQQRLNFAVFCARYEFQVSALNAAGEGPRSPTVIVTVTDVIDPIWSNVTVRGFMVVERSSSSIWLKWSPPPEVQSARYVISYRLLSFLLSFNRRYKEAGEKASSLTILCVCDEKKRVDFGKLLLWSRYRHDVHSNAFRTALSLLLLPLSRVCFVYRLLRGAVRALKASPQVLLRAWALPKEACKVSEMRGTRCVWPFFFQATKHLLL